MRLLELVMQAVQQSPPVNPWIPVGISALGVIGVLFLMLDRYRRKNPELIDKAMKMVELADKHADELREQVIAADETIKNLNFELKEANNKIITLNRELSDASDRVVTLEAQIRLMTRRVQENNNG